MGFEFWLKNEAEGVNLLLPVTPEGYEAAFGMEIETVRATEVGDINVTGHRKPQSIQLSSFFTAKDYIFANGKSVPVNTAMDYVLLIKRWMEEKAVIRLVIADGSGAKVNEQFYIEEIRYSQKKEDNGDMPYTISFRQYTPMQTATLQKGAAENTERPKGAEPAKPKQYTVAKGDCLSAIAREVYGDASQWRKIYEANKDIIGKNPNLIFPGQQYTIP